MALFLSESVKCYYSQAFWVKITTLPVAPLFTLTVRQRVARTGALETTAQTRLVALVSLASGSPSPPRDAGSGFRETS